jgi:hypothetical protein
MSLKPNNILIIMCDGNYVIKFVFKEKADHRLFPMFIPSFTKCGSLLTCY